MTETDHDAAKTGGQIANGLLDKGVEFGFVDRCHYILHALNVGRACELEFMASVKPGSRLRAVQPVWRVGKLENKCETRLKRSISVRKV